MFGDRNANTDKSQWDPIDERLQNQQQQRQNGDETSLNGHEEPSNELAQSLSQQRPSVDNSSQSETETEPLLYNKTPVQRLSLSKSISVENILEQDQDQDQDQTQELLLAANAPKIDLMYPDQTLVTFFFFFKYIDKPKRNVKIHFLD